ncbi:MAG TPA: HAD-IA family hydrolase, partial [Candidatus Sulfobium mesophilum]|nr:HAD-IA family hydrolase [Candidatus Sulfobium mesophilum]
YKVLDIKLKKTRIGKYFDATVTAFELGYPKEMREFWEKAEKMLGFRKERSLFIDDTKAVLRAAKKFGIKYILYKSISSSKAEKGSSEEFQSLDDFRELMPQRQKGV